MIDSVNQSLKSQKARLLDHPLYKQIKSPEHLNCFMEHHVFAVWDFMSLLKALQEKFTKTTTPWYPVGNAEIRYLVNEIVLAEESDLNFFGKHQSHFEMYLDAMKNSGANQRKIQDFLLQVTRGSDIFLVIAVCDLPASIKQFLKFTFELISEGKPHKIAAAFTFGREGLIPEMFSSIINKVQQNFPKEDLNLFKYYFDRHIEHDADENGPMAYKMIEELCGEDALKWTEVKYVSRDALNSRAELWDGIYKEISEKQIGRAHV